MTEPTTPQLTEREVEELATQDGELIDEWPEPVIVITPGQRDALVRDWRAMRAENATLREKYTRLAEASGEWARLLDHIRLWSKCADSYPLDEHINNIATQNNALREQLAQLTGERDALLRGEFICQRCHLRKDAEFESEVSF